MAAAPFLLPPQDNFKTKPYAHQLAFHRAYAFHEFYGLGAEMGCGKSKMLVDNICALWTAGKIDAAVVFAPKGPYQDWKDSHFPEHMWDSVPYTLVEWRAAPSKKLLDEFRAIAKPEPGKLHVFVFNIESILGEMPQKIMNYVLTNNKTLVAIDESTSIGSPTARRTKILMKMRDKATYRRCMTGETTPNSPLTAFSQCEFLQAGSLGHSSFWSFKGEFCKQVELNLNSRAVKTIQGYQHMDKLHERMSKFWFFVKKIDCLDLPAKLPSVVKKFDMGPKQQAAYDQMKEESIVQLAQILEKPTAPVMMSFEQILEATSAMGDEVPMEADPAKLSTASLVIVKMLRLHQIACGFIKSDDGTEQGFDEPNPQLEMLLYDLEHSCPRGALIWCDYRRNIIEVEAAIAAKFGQDTVRSYFGDTSPDDRRAAKKEFQKPDSELRFLVLNPATARYGLTLTATDTCIYYSNRDNRENRMQSEDRIHRIGQQYPCSYLDYVARGSVAEKILKSYAVKGGLSAQINKSNWREMFT